MCRVFPNVGPLRYPTVSRLRAATFTYAIDQVSSPSFLGLFALPFKMFVVGLQCAGSAFLAAGFKLQLTLALVTLVIVVSLCPRPGPKEKMNAPATLPGLSILRILPFFRRRFDFMNEGFRSSGQPLFQFNLLRVSRISDTALRDCC